MRRVLPFLLVAAAPSLALPATVRTASDVIVNGGFESGRLSPWRQAIDRGGPTDWQVNQDPMTGRFAATVRGNKLLLQDVTPTPGAQVTRLSFALKNSDASFNTYRIVYQGGAYADWVVDPADGDWHDYDVTRQIDRSRTIVAFGVFGVLYGDRYITTLDDVQLSAVPEPAQAVALAFAVAAALTRRRR